MGATDEEDSDRLSHVALPKSRYKWAQGNKERTAEARQGGTSSVCQPMTGRNVSESAAVSRCPCARIDLCVARRVRGKADPVNTNIKRGFQRHAFAGPFTFCLGSTSKSTAAHIWGFASGYDQAQRRLPSDLRELSRELEHHERPKAVPEHCERLVEQPLRNQGLAVKAGRCVSGTWSEGGGKRARETWVKQ